MRDVSICLGELSLHGAVFTRIPKAVAKSLCRKLQQLVRVGMKEKRQ